MLYIPYNKDNKFKVAILIKTAALSKDDIHNFYIIPNESKIPSKDYLALELEYDTPKKCSAATSLKHLENEIFPVLVANSITDILVCDAVYFKKLTKSNSTEKFYGYTLPCAIKGYEHLKITLCPNYTALTFNPSIQNKINICLGAFSNSVLNQKHSLGQGVIHSCSYPDNFISVGKALLTLLEYPALTCDIETYGLHVSTAGIGTISFAWDQHNGVAFRVSIGRNAEDAVSIKRALYNFFTQYKGTLIFHNASFDVKMLIYNCFMLHDQDHKGALKGIETLTRSIHDTKLIAYTALNSTVKPSLKLKVLAHEFAGNYAEDVKDITKIPVNRLLEYNLVDCLSTWYVFNKYHPVMLNDNQEDIYNSMWVPSLRVLLQVELVGMPIDMAQVNIASSQLHHALAKEENNIKLSSAIRQTTNALTYKFLTDKNSKLKVKQYKLDEITPVVFNPRSANHLTHLLYTVLQLPVIDLTDTKLPATGAKTLKKLLNQCDDPYHMNLIESLITINKLGKILSTFIPALKTAVKKSDNYYYLHGGFNIGGTVSGRLSSSGPNLQQIPSHSTYAKIIKKCFKAPPGFVMAGADFASLEDRVSALTTKDKNKIKVYVGHTVYKLCIDNVCHHIRDDAMVDFNGKLYTGEEFYDAYS